MVRSIRFASIILALLAVSALAPLLGPSQAREWDSACLAEERLPCPCNTGDC